MTQRLISLTAGALTAMIFIAWQAKPPQPIVRDWASLNVKTLDLATTYQVVNITGKGTLDMQGRVHLEKGVTRAAFMRALAATITVNHRPCRIVVEEQ